MNKKSCIFFLSFTSIIVSNVTFTVLIYADYFEVSPFLIPISRPCIHHRRSWFTVYSILYIDWRKYSLVISDVQLTSRQSALITVAGRWKKAVVLVFFALYCLLFKWDTDREVLVGHLTKSRLKVCVNGLSASLQIIYFNVQLWCFPVSGLNSAWVTSSPGAL